jgi:Ran GTPase-activating protein (RanGAP) involved in mRNA processing and transport
MGVPCSHVARMRAAAARAIGRGGPVLGGLKRLELAENWLRDEGVQVVAELLCDGTLPQLAELDLARNGIGPAGARALAAALERRAAPRLEVLNLNMNWIGAQGCALLAPALGLLPALSRFAISQNELLCEGGARLFEGLERCHELVHLDVSNNALGQATVRLPPKLQHLDLADNALLDAGVEGLARSLASMACSATIRHVDLRLNQMSEAALPALRQLVAHSPQLRRLDLRGNAITNLPPDVLHGGRLGLWVTR